MVTVNSMLKTSFTAQHNIAYDIVLSLLQSWCPQSVLAFVRSEWFFGSRGHLGSWMIAVLFSLFLHPLIKHLRGWKIFPGKLRESLRKYKVEVSPEGVSIVSDSLTVRRFGRGDIQRAEEVSSFWRAGLYLRTANRYRWLLIPAKIDQYVALKGELMAMGIPIESASIGPNWEEFVGVFAFCATLLCPMFLRSTRALTINLVAALLLAVIMVFITNANPDAPARIRRLGFIGAFIPACLTALWFWIRK